MRIILLATTAMVVDDMAMNLLLINKILEKLGCTVVAAKNGQEAIEMTNATNYDIVFMDCHMPDMDGFQATKKSYVTRIESAVVIPPSWL